MNQLSASIQRQARAHPDGNQALIYISSETKASVYVDKYPGGKPVETLIGFFAPTGLCSDKNGDIWVADTDKYSNTGYLDEYAPGGKHPIATLTDPSNSPVACSVDPTTGNLAVANSGDNILIYPNAQGPGTLYSTVGLVHKPNTITYDDAGNAYFADVSGSCAWLPAGGSNMMKFTLKPRAMRPGPMRWDGQYLTVLAGVAKQSQVWRYQVLGGTGKRIGIVQLDQCCLHDYAIGDAILAATMPRLGEATVIAYPAGGKGFLGLTVTDPLDIAISKVSKIGASRPATSQSSNLYVANRGQSGAADSIQVFSDAGKHLRKITQGLDSPDAMAFDATGALYVANYGNGTVTVYPSGSDKLSETIYQGVDMPIALAIDDSSGEIYVANGFNPGNVAVYSLGGNPLLTIEKGMHQPAGETLDSAGDLYVANESRSKKGYSVSAYAPGKKAPSLTISRDLDEPRAVALDASQNVYAANWANATVTVYAPGRKKVLRTISNSVSSPTALAFDSSENLYVLNTPPFSSDVSVYQAGTGRVLRLVSKGLRDSAAIALDAANNLYVTSVTSIGAGYVIVYSAGTSKILRKIPVGAANSYPVALGFGP